MFVVEATHAPVKVHFGDVTGVFDAEGNAVPDEDLAFELKSTDENVLTVSDDPDTDDEKAFVVAFGAPGLASLEGTIKAADDGTLLATRGAQFTLKAGPADHVTGGDLNVEGLTETPNP